MEIGRKEGMVRRRSKRVGSSRQEVVENPEKKKCRGIISLKRERLRGNEKGEGKLKVRLVKIR